MNPSAETAARQGHAADPPPPGMALYLPIWAGYMISALGSVLVGFALGVTVYQETGSVSRYTLLGLSTLLPTMLFTPIVGVLADRFDRRKILILCGIGSSLVNAVLYMVVRHEPYNLWHIYPLLMINAGIAAWVWPTFSAATTLIVRKRDLGRASGLSQIGSSVSSIVGPSLAAVLLLWIGLRGIVLLNLVSFLVPTAILLLVRFPQPKESEEGAKAKGSFWQEALSGWTFIRERPALLQLLITFAAVNLCMSWVHILLTPLVLSFASPLALGIVLGIAGLGTLVGSIATTVWGGPKRRRVHTIFGVIGFCALVLFLAGFQPDVTLIASGAFFFVLGFPVIGACVKVIWQTKVPPDIQGRVFAARRMIAGSTMPLALITAGPLSDDFFEPMMAPGGALAGIFGQFLGVGPGRGIGLLFMILGVALLGVALFAFRSKALMGIEEDLPEALADDHDADIRFIDRDAGLGRRHPLQAALMVAILAGTVWAALATLRPPEPLPTSADPTVFSAERARTRLDALAPAPHPVGSAMQRQVREYLVGEIEALGLDPVLQPLVVRSREGRLAQVVEVVNVLARLEGQSDAPGAVALVAHYDSVPTSPGAADNGAAVASLLETARALMAGPPLDRDVIFLFTDAEETGLHGARAFVEQHPWAREVGAVVNFDARGHGGPVLMFQTGEENGAWIPHFLRNTDLPVASSVMSHLYQILPNDTDFTVFDAAEMPGYNFAFIEGLTHYHTGLDVPDEVELSSIQHQGELALGLARSLGSLESLPEDRPDRTYFNLLGPVTVHYGWIIAWGSAILAVLAFIALVMTGLRSGQLTIFGLSQGMVAFIGVLLAVPVAITLLWMILNHGFGVPTLMGSTQYAGHFMVGFALVAFTLFVIVHRFFRNVVSLLDVTVGSLVWWVLMVVLTTEAWLPPTTNFLFAWPLLVAVLALWPLVARKPEDDGGAPPRWPIFLGLAASGVVGILLLVPLEAALYTGLQSIYGLGGPPLALGILLLAVLAPQIELIAGRRRSYWFPIALGVAGLSVVAVTTFRSLTEDLPRSSTALYAHDTDADEHHWYSFQLRPDSWNRALGFQTGDREPFNTFLPGTRPLLHADAPDLDVPEAEIEILEVRRTGAVGEARLRLRSVPGAESRIFWASPGDALLDARLAGTSVSLISPDERPVALQRIPVPAEEEMVIRWRGPETIELAVVDQVADLPTPPDLPPRPDNYYARTLNSLLRSDSTMQRRTFTLDSTAVLPAVVEEAVEESEGEVVGEEAPVPAPPLPPSGEGAGG